MQGAAGAAAALLVEPAGAFESFPEIGSPDDPSDGAGETTIARLIVEAADPNHRTHIVFEAGLPIARRLLEPGGVLTVYDSAAEFGDRTRLDTFQVDNPATDSEGHARWIKLTGVLPASATGAPRLLTVRRAAAVACQGEAGITTAPGVPIAIADVLATDYACVAEIGNLRPLSGGLGPVLRAAARDGLTAPTTWSPATRGPCRMGLWRTGPVCSEWVVAVPLRDPSGRAHPHLQAWFHIAAYKARPGPVSPDNPILAIRTDAFVENGWVNPDPEAGNNRAYHYDCRILDGSGTVHRWAAPAHPGALTLRPGTGSVVTARRSTGAWTAADRGIVLVSNDADAGLRILNRVDDREARAWSHGTWPAASVSADGYTVHGLAHPPFSRFKRRLWWGTEPRVEVAVVGPGSDDPVRGMSRYVISTRLVQNFAWQPPDGGTTAQLDEIAGSRPFSSRDNGDCGDFSRSQGSPGAAPDIGLYPSYTLQGFLHFDATGRRRVFENADLRQQGALFFRDLRTGKPVRPDAGTDWSFSSAWGNHIPQAGNSYAMMGFAHSHWGDMFYLPYLLRGDFADMEGLHGQSVRTWIGAPFSDRNSRHCGSQLTRHPFTWDGPFTDGNPGGRESPQLRTIAWGIRATIHALALMPDEGDLLGWDKAVARTVWGNAQAAARAFYIDLLTAPDNDPATPFRYLKDGPHFLIGAIDGAGAVTKQWQHNMVISQLAHAGEIGVLSADGMAMLEWLAATPMASLDPVRSSPLWTLQSDLLYKTHNGVQVKTVEDHYRTLAYHGMRGNAFACPTEIDFRPLPAVGSDIVVDVPRPDAMDCFPNPVNYDWYAGQALKARIGAGTAAFAEIVQVLGPNRARVRIIRDLPGPRFKPGLPLPAPGDTVGMPWMPAAWGEPDYVAWMYHVLGYLIDIGYPGAAERRAMVAAMYRTNDKTLPLGGHHSVEPRTAH